MDVLEGRKLLWCWHPETLGGVEAIVSRALRYGVTVLAFKHDDGGKPFSDSQSTFGLNPAEIIRYRDWCHLFGIKFGLWGYHYGADWRSETQMVARALSLAPDFYVVDWEAEFSRNIGGNLLPYLTACVNARAGKSTTLYHAPLPQPRFWVPEHYQAFQYCFDGMLPQIYHGAMELPLDQALDICYQDYVEYGLTAKPIYPIGQAYNIPAGDITAWASRATGIYGARGLGWWDMDSATDDMMLAISRAPLGQEENMRRVNGLHPDYKTRVKLEVGNHGIPCRTGFGLLATDRRVVLDIAVTPVLGYVKAPIVVVKDGDCSYADVIGYNGDDWRKNVTAYMHSNPEGIVVLDVQNGPVWVEMIGILEAG
jgi:hypothetical protein